MGGHDWLGVFCGALGCDAGFAKAMKAGLEPELRSLGLSPDGFMLAPPLEAAPRYEDGIAYLEADLVGPDNFGHPVTIALACGTHPGERVDPRRPVPPGCTLRAEWQSLPRQVLRDSYLPPARPLVVLPADLEARVRWERFTWPEVPLTVVGDGTRFEANAANAIAEKLESGAGAWNGAHPARGIKHVGAPHVSEDGAAIEAFVDFGRAPVEALVDVLRALVAGAPSLREIHVGRASASSNGRR